MKIDIYVLSSRKQQVSNKQQGHEEIKIFDFSNASHIRHYRFLMIRGAHLYLISRKSIS